MLLNNNQIKYHTSDDISVIEIKDGEGISFSTKGNAEISGYNIGIYGKKVTLTAEKELNLTCEYNSIMLLKDAKEAHSRTLSGKIELESPENEMVDIMSDEEAAADIQKYKEDREKAFPQQTPEGIPITAENKDEKGIAEMLREYWERTSPDYNPENDKKFHSDFKKMGIGNLMTENDYLFQQFLLHKLGMSEEERKLYTSEGQMEVLMEDINMLGGLVLLKGMTQMAGNDIANFKNTMPKINLPKFPKFPNDGGSFQFAFEGAGLGSIAVAVEGAGVAEGVIGLGNGGFSGFPDMGSLGLGLKMMESSGNSGEGNEIKVIFTDDSDKHLVTIEGFNKKKTGIKGAHNKEVFEQFDRPIKQEGEIQYSDIEGIYTINYRVAKMYRGEPVPDEWGSNVYTKTLYDPKIISTDTIKKLAREALSKQEPFVTPGGQTMVQGQTLYKGKIIKFEGWVNSDNTLKSYYPVIEWTVRR